jgi:pimeloyl-ACP methyl ester carboxylesterase
VRRQCHRSREAATAGEANPSLHGLGGDVRALVFVDAFMPDEGETVFQILGGSGSALDVPDPTTVLDLVGYPESPEGDLEAFLKPDTVHNAFAQDLPEADRWLIVASQRPVTLSANTTPSGAPAWKTLPSWAVVGTADLVIPPDTQRSMAERAGATISEVPGHTCRWCRRHRPRSTRSWLRPRPRRPTGGSRPFRTRTTPPYVRRGARGFTLACS